MVSKRELERYKRQILLFGEEGQERLKRSHIFIAGAGGLGSPIAIYLAVAGVGTITIVDMDAVDVSNLNRQILHTDRDVGKKKTVSAIEKLREYNADITINAIDTMITADNGHELVGRADGIVDAMDNFPVRYLLNRVALARKIPFFHGAIRGFHGQATTILPGKTPCLECIFKDAPPKEVFPVVGTTAGVIGTIQANEVIKYLTGHGDLLAGRLFIWDGLAATGEHLMIEKNPACPACGAMHNQTKGTER
ncbi:MAG: HesA/MoeB/ThiF family protein [Methanomicrobiales archaeon]|nr:HesA/MoeB/ThiF family protein [Methanomicrobiales archaeon]